MRIFRIPAVLIVEIPDLTVRLSVLQGTTVLIAFSESVEDFIESDIEVTNGTLSGFIGNGREFCVAVTPTGDADASLYIPEDVAATSDGRTNLESNRLVIGNA